MESSKDTFWYDPIISKRNPLHTIKLRGNVSGNTFDRISTYSIASGRGWQVAESQEMLVEITHTIGYVDNFSNDLS